MDTHTHNCTHILNLRPFTQKWWETKTGMGEGGARFVHRFQPTQRTPTFTGTREHTDPQNRTDLGTTHVGTEMPVDMMTSRQTHKNIVTQSSSD